MLTQAVYSPPPVFFLRCLLVTVSVVFLWVVRNLLRAGWGTTVKMGIAGGVFVQDI